MLFVKTGMVDYMAFNLTGMMLPVILSLQDARRNRTNGLYIYILVVELICNLWLCVRASDAGSVLLRTFGHSMPMSLPIWMLCKLLALL